VAKGNRSREREIKTMGDEEGDKVSGNLVKY
jgi:hypothetical protein